MFEYFLKAEEFMKSAIHRIIAYLISYLLKPGAVWDEENFRIWERHGYHITPVHYYFPIPDCRDIQIKTNKELIAPGIDLKRESQVRLMIDVFPRFCEEYNRFPVHRSGEPGFFLENDAFTGIDPFVYYCIVRNYRPEMIIEVGSGFSTLLGNLALTRNRNQGAYKVIDPWPRDFTKQYLQCNAGIDHIAQRVECVDPSLFEQLKANDILFIDGSHVIRTSGDVCFLVLEILPRLSRGVIVHIHDIYLPEEYPQDLITGKHMFWTEQYLLQAYLAENSKTEVLFATNYISKTNPDLLKETFPTALWWGGCSFWMVKQ
jgi:hypothetical protein